MGLRKEIKAVLDDVTRDPRAALHAIDILVHAKIEGTKAVKPIFQVSVSDVDGDKIKVTIDHNSKKIRPDHAMAAMLTIKEFAQDRAAEAKAEGCKCADQGLCDK